MDSRLDHRDCYCRSLDETAVTNYITGPPSARLRVLRFTGKLDMFGNQIYPGGFALVAQWGGQCQLSRYFAGAGDLSEDDLTGRSSPGCGSL